MTQRAAMAACGRLMNNYPDLEVGLHRRDADSYAVELRFSLPDDDGTVRLERGGLPLVRFDTRALRARAVDPVAYGQFLADSLFGEPALRMAFAEARTSAETLGLPLRLRLYIGASAPELHDLRWETLRDPLEERSLLANEQVLFSRYLSSIDRQPVRLRPREELRALVVIASPAESGRLPAGRPTAAGAGCAGRKASGAGGARRCGRARCSPRPAARRCRACSIACAPRTTTSSTWSATARWSGVSRGCGWRTSSATGHRGRGRVRRAAAGAAALAAPGRAGLVPERRGRRRGARRRRRCPGGAGPAPGRGGRPGGGGHAGRRLDGDDRASSCRPSSGSCVHHGQIDRAVAVARGEVRDRPDCWMPALFMRLKSGRLWYLPGFAGDGRASRMAGADPQRTARGAVRRSSGRACCDRCSAPRARSPGAGPRRTTSRWRPRREDLPQVAQFLAVNAGPPLPARDAGGRPAPASCCDRARRRPDRATCGVRRWSGWLGAVLGAPARAGAPRAASRPGRARLPIYITTNPDDLLTRRAEPRREGAQRRALPLERATWSVDVRGPTGDRPDPRRPLVYHLFGRLHRAAARWC